MPLSQLDALTQSLARLPGLGPRSARRAVLHLLKRRDTALPMLIAALQAVERDIATCSICGNLDVVAPCSLCTDPRRDPALLCVVEEVADLWALERGRLFPGRFHVLGGRLSALDGIGPEQLRVRELAERVAAGGITEVVLALNATLDGQTTTHFLSDTLAMFPAVKVSSIAHGVPVGGELDYLDEGTLTQALRARRPVG